MTERFPAGYALPAVVHTAVTVFADILEDVIFLITNIL